MRYGNQAVDIPKIAAQDTTLTVSKVGDGKTTFPVPSGTEVELHVPGLHHNRTLSGFVSWEQVLAVRYWKEPHRFMPERFLGDWPKDAFIPFSQGISLHIIRPSTTNDHFAGARACLGRRC